MTRFHFSDQPATRHRVHSLPGSNTLHIDDVTVAVQRAGEGCFVVPLDGRPERLHAVAHGDTVHVHLRGRAWRLERADPTRSAGAGAGAAAGASHAPMPGVVVSLQAALGQVVAEGDALLVIESMKLQMTIAAPAAGVVAELPLAVGQTFQRGAVLARVQAEGAHA